MFHAGIAVSPVRKVHGSHLAADPALFPEAFQLQLFEGIVQAHLGQKRAVMQQIYRICRGVDQVIAGPLADRTGPDSIIREERRPARIHVDVRLRRQHFSVFRMLLQPGLHRRRAALFQRRFLFLIEPLSMAAGEREQYGGQKHCRKQLFQTGSVKHGGLLSQWRSGQDRRFAALPAPPIIVYNLNIS